jgi:hypothetical protein
VANSVNHFRFWIEGVAANSLRHIKAVMLSASEASAVVPSDK